MSTSIGKNRNVFELSFFCVFINKFLGFGLFCKGEMEQASECSQCHETEFQSLRREEKPFYPV